MGLEREAPLPRRSRAVNVMYSIEPPAWGARVEPTHLASFTRLVSECAGLPLKPVLINSHSGHDSWGSGEKAVAFLKKALT